MNLFEGYREVRERFLELASVATVDERIHQFRELVNRNQVHGNQRNIDYWGKQGWSAFDEFVQASDRLPSKRQTKKGKLSGKAVTLRDDHNWHIVIPLDKQSSCFHGRGTDWCTTKPLERHFEQYFYQQSITLIYCLHKPTSNQWAIAYNESTESMEFFDQRDRKLTRQVFEQQTGLSVKQLIAQVKATPSRLIADGRAPYELAIRRLSNYFDSSDRKLGERNPQIEQLLLMTQQGVLCARYVKEVPVATIPATILLRAFETEPELLGQVEALPKGIVTRILKNSPWNIQYVRRPSFEQIAMVLERGGFYVHYLDITDEQRKRLSDQYPEVAAYLAKTSNTRLSKEQENRIAHSSALAINDYLEVYRQGRWQEAEPLILTSAVCILKYVKNNLNGKDWPEARNRLLSEAEQQAGEDYNFGNLIEYARLTGMRRWSAIEPLIIHDAFFAADYAIKVLRARWREAEAVILSVDPAQADGDSDRVIDYVKEFDIVDYMEEYPEYFPDERNQTDDDYWY